MNIYLKEVYPKKNKSSINSQFTILLTFPEGITMLCSLEGSDIKNVANGKLGGSVVCEQKLITKGAKVLFILKKYNSI